MYKKVPNNMDFVKREGEVLQFWTDNDVFRRSMEQRKQGETYTFYDGPPTANGKPHIGHVLTRVIKDMIPRYHAMKGQMVPRNAGWDTHGLPVRKSWGWMVRSRSRNTGWTSLSSSARKASGNTRECGSSFPTSWASGRIWTIRM